MKVSEGTAPVALHGIVLPNDIHILVIDILFLVVIAILIIIGRSGQNGTSGELPSPGAIIDTEKFVECLKRTNPLYVLQTESMSIQWSSTHLYSSTKSSSSFIHR